MTDHMTPPNLCAHCGEMIDCTSEAFHGEAEPGPGDVTLCVYCGGLLRFKDDMTVRMLVQEDLEDFDDAMIRHLILAHQAWALMDDERPKKASERPD